MGAGKYITYEMMEDLVAEAVYRFPEFVTIVDAGIRTQDLTPITHSEQIIVKVSFKGKDEYATGILTNGAHHARELGSVQFVCYQLLRVLYEY